MTYVRSIGIALGVLLVAGAASAHHLSSAFFDVDERFTLTGELVRIDWRNPHIELSVDVADDQGQLVTWRLEGPSPGELREYIPRSDFADAIGKPIDVEASPARDGSQWGLLRMLTLPGGNPVPLCPANC